MEEITRVKVTLVPNTGINLAHTECLKKSFLCLDAEDFHLASINDKGQRNRKDLLRHL